MRTLYTFILLVLISTTCVTAQSVEKMTLDAKQLYDNGKYELAIAKIALIKPLYKTPRPSLESLDIKARVALIEIDPLLDYDLLKETREIVQRYLANSNSKKDGEYYTVVRLESSLNSYPQDKASFDEAKALIEQQQKDEAAAIAREEAERVMLIKQYEEQERLDREQALREQKERQAREEQLRLNREQKEREQQLEIIRLKEQTRLAQVQAQIDSETRAKKYAIEERLRQEIAAKKERRALKSFASLGYQGGELAPYGLIFEVGGKAIGFHISARTNLEPGDLFSEEKIANRTEFQAGPNIKIFKRLYLNLGVGYGYEDVVIDNNVDLERLSYYTATSGLMIRLNRFFNINGGVSMPNIDKEVYKPEFTFGISFNVQ